MRRSNNSCLHIHKFMRSIDNNVQQNIYSNSASCSITDLPDQYNSSSMSDSSRSEHSVCSMAGNSNSKWWM